MSGSPIMIRAQCVRAPRKFAPTWGKSVLAEQVSNTPNRTDHWATGKSTRENKVVWWKFSNDKTTCDISMYWWLIPRIFLIISAKLRIGSWDGVEQSANIDHCPHCQLFQLSQKHSSSIPDTVLSMVGAISYSTHWISSGAGKYRHWLTSSHWPSSLIHPVSNIQYSFSWMHFLKDDQTPGTHNSCCCSPYFSSSFFTEYCVMRWIGSSKSRYIVGQGIFLWGGAGRGATENSPGGQGGASVKIHRAGLGKKTLKIIWFNLFKVCKLLLGKL